jgi:hypothetical protein
MYELVAGARTSFPLPSPAGGLETIKESFDVGVFFAVEGTLLEISFSKGVSCEGGIVGYSAPRDSR